MRYYYRITMLHEHRELYVVDYSLNTYSKPMSAFNAGKRFVKDRCHHGYDYVVYVIRRDGEKFSVSDITTIYRHSKDGFDRLCFVPSSWDFPYKDALKEID